MQSQEQMMNNQVSLSEAVAAQAYGLSLMHLRYPRRAARRAALARQIAIYLARTVFALSFSALGRGFRRDRSTAVHAVQRVEAMRCEPEFDRMLDWLETTLRSATEVRP